MIRREFGTKETHLSQEGSEPNPGLCHWSSWLSPPALLAQMVENVGLFAHFWSFCSTFAFQHYMQKFIHDLFWTSPLWTIWLLYLLLPWITCTFLLSQWRAILFWTMHMFLKAYILPLFPEESGDNEYHVSEMPYLSLVGIYLTMRSWFVVSLPSQTNWWSEVLYILIGPPFTFHHA